jgi:hypothetical protein
MISSQPVPFVSRSRFGSSFGQSMSTSMRRLGEREVAAADAHLPLRAEHPPGEGRDRPLQVGHRHTLADGQPLDLVELDLAARADRLVAVAHPRQDHADRLAGTARA